LYRSRETVDQLDAAGVAVERVTALLDACHEAGRTWLPMADIRKALDVEA
jgi:hypothetical protein